MSGWFAYDRQDYVWQEKKLKKLTYDHERKRPVIKCSICNGEQVAGFKDIDTGRFEEVMLIRSRADLDCLREPDRTQLIRYCLTALGDGESPGMRGQVARRGTQRKPRFSIYSGLAAS